ncbi:hypothetical protein P154DRAFT_443600 [Amniculicola lignicola CBS 123094]|uniref:Extracellular membrane protein CFEM domain-containing protein n=1 Tax=Amniculicola lignicola CBS 123094 TaxID=1392246 RepID=A0A6A5W8A7_9PLEO|nr:hypothetical protein P154DRAFT_443600 [Amniculicola lignicola CBS 123094]
MRVLYSVVTVLTGTTLASAQLTFNITQALQPGNLQKYKCLNNDRLAAEMPECIRQCQADGDGCAVDGFAYHCVNCNVYSDLIEPCAFPPSLGGYGTFILAELGIARPIVSNMCNFFSVTLYAAYAGCPQPLSKRKTDEIVVNEPTITTT